MGKLEFTSVNTAVMGLLLMQPSPGEHGSHVWHWYWFVPGLVFFAIGLAFCVCDWRRRA